jgi:hypothetical protein
MENCLFITQYFLRLSMHCKYSDCDPVDVYAAMSMIGIVVKLVLQLFIRLFLVNYRGRDIAWVLLIFSKISMSGSTERLSP